MHIVLPGALPDSAPIAAELAKRLPGAAPTLCAWLAASQARVRQCDVQTQGCTPFEAWQLRHAGFEPAPGEPLAAGLGPLRVPEPPDSAAPASAPSQPVWIADLAYVALGTDRASLLPAESLQISPAEGAALFEAVQPLFEGSGFDARAVAPDRWLVTVPTDFALRGASPAAVRGHALSAWWDQQPAARPWRRLLNEIQMVWHGHAINESRLQAGKPPVNGLWLYGGARRWPAPPPVRPVPLLADALRRPAEDEDWAAWLDAAARIDRDILVPLSPGPGKPPLQPARLSLFGRDREAALTLQPRGPLLRWLPARASDWNSWWSPLA